MVATAGTSRAVNAQPAASPAWVVTLLLASAVAASGAWAQAPTSATTLKGGVQQNVPQGDVFNGASSSAACQQVDPECGGTNRECLNQFYHSTGIVMSVQQSQSLYRQTGGRIWAHCGTCRTNVICWANPGFQDVIAGGTGPTSGQTGTPSGSPAGPQQPGASPMDDTMRNVVASCGAVLQQQGSLNARPSCRSANVMQWCKRFQQNNPTCVAIVADSGGGGSGQPTGSGGNPNAGPAPRRAVGQPAIPLPVYVPQSSPTGGPSAGTTTPVPAPPVGGPASGTSGPPPPLQGGIKKVGPPVPPPDRLQSVVFSDGNRTWRCYFDRTQPFYNSPPIPGYKSAHGDGAAGLANGTFTVDLNTRDFVNTVRSFDDLTGGKRQLQGTIEVNCDPSTGYILSMRLSLGGRSYTLTPSQFNFAVGY